MREFNEAKEGSFEVLSRASEISQDSRVIRVFVDVSEACSCVALKCAGEPCMVKVGT